MSVTRRHVLQLATGSLPLIGVAQAADLKRNFSFNGAGLYLYPAWGEPEVYLVTVGPLPAAELEFRDATNCSLLWTQSFELTGSFAGKLEQ